jgi:hypothetical protein
MLQVSTMVQLCTVDVMKMEGGEEGEYDDVF